MSDQPTLEPPVDPLGSRDLAWKQQWLAEYWDKRGTSGRELNWWRAFAWVAADQATKENSLPWAAIATRVYDWVDDADPPSARYQGWALRVAMIGALGPRAGDPILDPQRVIDWFYAGLPWTPGQALGYWLPGTKVSEEVRQEFRKLEYKVAILEQLAGVQPPVISAELAEWIRVRALIPSSIAMLF